MKTSQPITTEIAITVRLFAMLRDRAGTEALTLRLPIGSTVARALEELRSQRPQVVGLLGQAACAVNRQVCRTDQALGDGDELALLPPVSGG